jgi:hypothetical protein
LNETYIGGKMPNTFQKARAALQDDSTDNKTPVLGMIERGGRVSALALPHTKARLATVMPILRRLIHRDVYTDAAQLPARQQISWRTRR